MEGHIFSVFAVGSQFTIPLLDFPMLALLISGGHTEIVDWESAGQYSIVGQTVDDAIGEAFDKVARLLGLPYPGGPEISRLSEQCVQQNSDAVSLLGKPLPRPMLHSPDLNFSFSGLKTAVRYLVESLPKPLSTEHKMAIAREFETAVTEVCVKKMQKAIELYSPQSIIVAGGVSANKCIKNGIQQLCNTNNIPCVFPTGNLSGDNALMIAVAGIVKSYNNSSEISVNRNPLLTADASLHL